MNRCKTCLLACALALCASPVLAGVLAADPNVYVDGSNIVWHGSTNYQGYELDGITPTELTGYIEWAVYAPGTFPVAFTPDVAVPLDQFVYAYQVFDIGNAPTSSFAVDLANEAYNAGSFSGGGVTGISPFAAYIVPFDTANWLFGGIFPGQTSSGLLFTSPNVPMPLSGTTIDHGSSGSVLPVPSPDSFSIPEPSTYTLAVCGLVGFALQWARRRGRRL